MFILTDLKALPAWWAKTSKPMALAVVAVAAAVREAIGSRPNGVG
ncbi:hypothetical protein FRUB_08336 [Fimbriiglobus ruber]|uniref:Uncharacterized protein n=1 Tax=Fimbriiglobus ruber TaxID=1908690 RepID=A0A225D4A1_9BACT|nr:hypothetical protein FRUB_08336 [Fimbriiglobus ruber]